MSLLAAISIMSVASAKADTTVECFISVRGEPTVTGPCRFLVRTETLLVFETIPESELPPNAAHLTVYISRRGKTWTGSMRRIDLSKKEHNNSFGAVRPLDACWVNKIVRICAWQRGGLFGEDFRRWMLEGMYEARDWIYEARRRGVKITVDDPYGLAELMSPLNPFPAEKALREWKWQTSPEPDEELADIPSEEVRELFAPMQAPPGTSFMPPDLPLPKRQTLPSGNEPRPFDPNAWYKRTVPQTDPSPYMDPTKPMEGG